MQIKRLVFIFIFLASGMLWAKADSSYPVYPEVGKPMPEDFVLQNIKYFPKKIAHLDDFKGKWLILDFWTLHCGYCISSFPRINEEMKSFKDSVQFILVGAAHNYDPKGAIEDLYASIRERINLKLPCAFDSVLYNRYDLFSVPYVIVIDPKSIVRAISYKIDSVDLTQLMAGKTPNLAKAYRAHEDRNQISYNQNVPLLVNNNGGNDSDFLYRSILKKCGSEFPYAFDNIENVKNGLFQLARMAVVDLYKFAYMGKRDWGSRGKVDSLLHADYWPYLICNIKDSSIFRLDDGTGKNTYCYSLKVPKLRATKTFLMKVMQADLEHYFGYKAEIVEKEMTCLKLVILDERKIPRRQKGDTSTFQWINRPLKFYAANFSTNDLIKYLDDISTHQKMPVFDETGINEKLNLMIDCYWGDFDDVKKTLNRNGLDLVRGQRMMKTLVISDWENE